MQTFAFRHPTQYTRRRQTLWLQQFGLKSLGVEHAASSREPALHFGVTGRAIAWVNEPNVLRTLSSAARVFADNAGLCPTGSDPHSAQSAGTSSPDLPTDTISETVNEAALLKVVEEVQLATGATGAAIALVRGAEMVCCATSGHNAPPLWTWIDPDTGLTGRCMQTREVQQSFDTETDPRVNLEVCRRLKVRSIVVVPLLESGELVGIFEILSSQPNAFGPGDLTSLKSLTDRILESRRPQRDMNEIDPQRGLSVDPVQKEHLAREIFTASPQGVSGVRRSGYWMAVRTVSIVGVCVCLGWIAGHASWKMAVARAENQTSTPQREVEPAIERSALDKSDTTTGLPENVVDTLQPSGTHAVDPAEISVEATDNYVLTEVEPEYPKDAQRLHIQGQVVMKVLVGTDGMVRDIEVISGDPQLSKAAADAVRNWHFRPHASAGQPVEFESQITINFTLT